MAKHCIITDEVITKDNDSKAHVIPSALGGRLKPLGILCKNANTRIGDEIDLPLIQAFQSLMNLLNGSRDRGQNRPTPMIDESGKVYIFRFGEPLSLAAPRYEEVEKAGECHITIKARNLKEARTLLGRAKAKRPGFDIDEAMKHAVLEQQWPDGMLHHQLQIGPAAVFPAAFVAASIFAVHHGQQPHPQLKTYVTSFDPDHPALPPDTFYFMPAKRCVAAPAEVTHIVALMGDAATGRMLAYVELFNVVCIGVLIPFAGEQDIRETYAIDILTGKHLAAQIDEANLKSVPWAATHQLGDASLFAFTEKQIGNLIQLARQREWNAQMEQIVHRAFGPADGRPLMARDYANIVGEVVDFIKNLWKHPAFAPAIRQQQLPQFDAFCSQLEGRLPFFARCQFRRLVARHRAALADAARAIEDG
jgi:hypothetical protein